jgi:pimeloyl-ACP methyl ester carboxylesterase
VSFPSSDGVELEGRLAGGGTVGVVLSHTYPADQSSWWPFSDVLTDEGYLVLTYNSRGYCPGGEAGCSEGEKDIEEIWRDVLGAISFVRSQGADTVMLVGASMGGTASLIAAGRQGAGVSPTSFEGLAAGPEALAAVTAAKLFVAGVGDGAASTSAQDLYELSPPPKRLEVLTTDDHGTDILSGNQAGPAQTLILDYLQRYASS